MKLISLLILILLVAQQSVFGQTCDDPLPGSGGISYSNTIAYIRNYYRLHQREIDQHAQATYVSSNTIKFIGEFFNANQNFIGLNMYFINYPVSMNLDRNYKDQVMYAFVPISSDKKLDFQAFENYYNSLPINRFNKYEINRSYTCPGKCDRLLLSWTGNPQNPGTLPVTSPPNIDNGERLLFLGEQNILNYHSIYYLNQGQELNTLQTKRIYFDRNKFKILYDFISIGQNHLTYPLFGIYSMSYDFITTPRNNIHDHQTSLAFIPMKEISGQLEPAICDLLNHLNNSIYLSKMRNDIPKTLNHGEICPQVCHPQ